MERKRSSSGFVTEIADPEEFPELLTTALNNPATWVLELPVTPTPRVLASGHWDVNDILAAGTKSENR